MSSGLTTNYSLPYPISTDPVDVAGDIQDLADVLATFLTNPAFLNGINVANGTVATSNTTANVFNANSTTLNLGGAATTLNIGNASGQANFAGDVNVATGKGYEVNNVSVLTATTLGSSVVSSSLTSVGTLSSGTWSATTIAVDKGGTGLTSYAVGDIVYASGATTLAKLADVATGNALISGGVGVAPSWGKIALTTHVSGTLPVANGGTGITSLGSGVATWLGTPSSANLAAAITDETGSGSLVFATSPSLTTPNIGNATASYLTITGAGSGSEGGEMRLNGSPTYSGVIIDNFAGYYRIIQETPTVMMFSIQSTDINASANRITLNTDVASSPTEDAYFTVERGTSANVSLRWNETLDQWEFSNDGSTYTGIGSGGGGGTGLQDILMFAGM
jgi:hypothetical protein